MRSLRLTVPGCYWDSQIYSGKLYLWGEDGRLAVYDWDRIVDSLTDNQQLKFAITCALSRSDYLYVMSLAFKDPDVRRLVMRKLEQASNIEWEVPPKVLKSAAIETFENPLLALPIDIEIYNNTIYAATDDGLLATRVSGESHWVEFSPEPAKLWDCPLFSVQAHSSVLALSAGDAGLWEFSIDPSEPLYVDDLSVKQIGAGHSSSAYWSFASIYSSSTTDEDYMAAYRWLQEKGRWVREFVEIIPEAEIFGTRNGRSWGTQEKLYQLVDGGIKVVNYRQRLVPESRADAFKPLDVLPFETEGRDFVSGGASLFGTILELSSGLFVLRSDGQVTQIEGPIVRWRNFPRSKRYENQLHVILDDRLEIHSFNHDYFVDQSSKLAGFKFAEDFRRGFRRQPNV